MTSSYRPPTPDRRRSRWYLPLVVLASAAVLLASGFAGWGVVTLIQDSPTVPHRSIATPSPAVTPSAAPSVQTATPTSEPMTDRGAASALPAQPSTTDDTFVQLLLATGFPITTANSSQYIASATQVCTRLRAGGDVLADAATIPGTDTDNAEGFVYLSVAVYCDDLSVALP